MIRPIPSQSRDPSISPRFCPSTNVSRQPWAECSTGAGGLCYGDFLPTFKSLVVWCSGSGNQTHADEFVILEGGVLHSTSRHGMMRIAYPLALQDDFANLEYEKPKIEIQPVKKASQGGGEEVALGSRA